jgi:hypothetical protein
MPAYIGDGQAWCAQLSSAKIRELHDCWLFRRIGSRVSAGILEVVSTVGLVEAYDLRDGEWMRLTVFPGGTA